MLKPLLAARRPILLGHGDLEGRSSPAVSALSRHFVPVPRFGGKVKSIIADLEKQREQHNSSVLVTRQAPRLVDLLNDVGHPAVVEQDLLTSPLPRAIRVVKGVLDEGWALRGLPEGSFLLYSDAELFGWTKPSRRRAQRPRAQAPEAFFADVTPGDYVVHMEHGIGRFVGLVKMNLDEGSEREYLQVDYARATASMCPCIRPTG